MSSEGQLRMVIDSPLLTDIAVIGSGPGGAITACLLAEGGGNVLLIEEGPFLPLDSCAPFSRGEMVQKYRSGGITVAMGKPKVAYVEGRCVGGGSEINSGLYHRAPPDLLEQWRREFQVQALSESELEPHFVTCERDVSVSYLAGEAPAASLKLHQGAQALGWKSLEVPRWFRCTAGATGGGVRQSMTQTYLPRALQAGCRLLADTRVLRLRQQGGKWRLTAVDAPQDAAPRQVEIEAKTVFVCAGAIQTPAVLRRSGITRNVGQRLQMHPTIKVVARFGEAVNAAEMGVPVHQVKQFAPRFSFGCSISSRPYLALAMVDHPKHAPAVMANWHQCAIYYAMIRGGVGKVRCLPWFRDPLVRYGLNQDAFRDLADALRGLCRCLFAAGAVAIYPSLTGWRDLTEPDDLSGIPACLPPARTNLMTIHLFSSCPMGENRALAAADSFGRVHGVDRLYLGDGSLLCSAPGVNPQGTIMALARRNALAYLGQL